MAEKKKLSHILKRRETRSISGVTVIAIMTKPLPCPGEESQPGEKAAQSYTGKEPAAIRSIYDDYDSYSQIQRRMKDLEVIGHQVDKCEIINFSIEN